MLCNVNSNLFNNVTLINEQGLMDEPEAAPTSFDEKQAPTVEKLFAGSSFEQRRQSSMREVEEAKPTAFEPKATLAKAKSLTKNKSIEDNQPTTDGKKSAAAPKFSLFKRLGQKEVNANKATDKPRSKKDKIPDEKKGDKAFVLAAIAEDGTQLNYCLDKVRQHRVFN